MEILINILLVFILINTALKLSFWELRYLIIWSIVLGLFILGVYPYAMEQSRTQIEHWLQDSEILGNIAVMISLEVLICIEFCFISLNNMYDNKAKKWHKILDFYPCLLIFPALFYVLTQAMFSFVGVDFFMTAMGVGMLVVVIIPFFSYNIGILLPEKELRLEMHFLLSLIMSVLGFVALANGRIVYIPKGDIVEWHNVIKSLLFLLVFVVLGFLFSKFWWRFFGQKKLK